MIGEQTYLRDDFRQVEVSLQLRGLIPMLLASVAAFPPFWGMLQFLVVAVMVIVVLTIRIYEPRWGRFPRYLVTLLLVAYIAERAFSLYRGGQIAVVALSQGVATASLLFYLMPPERGMTFMAVLLSLMTLVTSGLTRNDMSYIASLWGFVIFLPALLTMSSLHEVVRADHLLWVRSWSGWRQRVTHFARHLSRLAITLAAGAALYWILPKPAVMPLARLGFENVFNSFMAKQDIGRGPVAKGATPFLEVEGADTPYLIGQIFDRYQDGAWAHTREKARSRTSKKGIFPMPPFLDDGVCEPRAPKGPAPVFETTLEIRPLVGLPDLLLLPEGTQEVRIASWHLPGVPPYFVNVWPPESTAAYHADVRHAARFPFLGPPHDTRPFMPEIHRVKEEPGQDHHQDGKDSKRFGFLGHAHEVPPIAPRDTEREVDPSVDPRLVTLARSLVEGVEGEIPKLQKILKFLQDGYLYDTRATTPEDAAVVPYFLFESKRGYCEHFATVTALMARAIGIPSRYVTGYMPQVTEKVGDRWLTRIRPKDAHAWVHVHLEGHGWVPVDPTEGLRSDSYLDTMESWITGDPLAYGHSSSWDLEMARSVLMSLSRSTTQVEDHLGEIVAGLVTGFALVGLIVWWRQKSGAAALARLAGTGVTSGTSVKSVLETLETLPEVYARGDRAKEALPGPEGSGHSAGRAVSPGAGTGDGASLAERHALALQAFQDLCHMLSARGLPARRADQTPLDYARTAEVSGVAPRLEALARQLNRLAFGPLEGSAELTREIEAAAADLAKQLSADR